MLIYLFILNCDNSKKNTAFKRQYYIFSPVDLKLNDFFTYLNVCTVI